MILLFILLAALANKIRGGLFNRFYQNTLMWKAVGAILMALGARFLLGWSWGGSLLLGAAWTAFLLPPWGAWFDIGTLPPAYERGGFFIPLYRWLGARLSQQSTDFIMMFLRGLMCIVLMLAVAAEVASLHPLLLTPALALAWTVAYALDRVWIKPFLNNAEFYAGAVIGLFIVIASQL